MNKVRKIRDAVTGVLVYQDEIFVIKRQEYLLAFPGYTAFPGGKVDKEDSDDPLDEALCRGHDPTLVKALSREFKEETNFDLIQALEKGQVLEFCELGIAVTPDFNPYRFKTHFFKVVLDHKPTFKVDEGEVSESGWIAAKSLMEQFYAGEVLAVPPIISLLKGLGKDIHKQVIEDLDFTYDSENEVPWIESIHNIRQLIPLSNTLPPANRTNCFIIGDKGERRVAIDPSPKDEDEYRKLLNTLKKIDPTFIFLTHHHSDHRQFSNTLARELEIPMGMSQYTYEKILQADPHFFKMIKIELFNEGKTLTRWNSEDVLIYEVPGHDEGQLAVAPRSGKWFIVGDLIQGVGTVVIGGEEGDMAKYFHSLNKVISLDPDVIIPSHGIAMGGTHFIRQALSHRLEREKQVLTLAKEGKDIHAMLDIIYPDLHEKLKPYALENIKSHHRKLSDEGFL